MFIAKFQSSGDRTYSWNREMVLVLNKFSALPLSFRDVSVNVHSLTFTHNHVGSSLRPILLQVQQQRFSIVGSGPDWREKSLATVSTITFSHNFVIVLKTLCHANTCTFDFRKPNNDTSPSKLSKNLRALKLKFLRIWSCSCHSSIPIL